MTSEQIVRRFLDAVHSRDSARGATRFTYVDLGVWRSRLGDVLQVSGR